MFAGRDSSETTCVLVELELGRVLDRDDALVVGDEAESTFRSVVLPTPVPPEIEDVQLAAHAAVAGTSTSSRRQRAELRRGRRGRQRVGGELADGQRPARSSASGGMIALTRRAVGQAGVDHRRRLRRRGDRRRRRSARSRASGGRRRRSARRSRRARPRALDVDLVGTVHHHLGDRGSRRNGSIGP